MAGLDPPSGGKGPAPLTQGGPDRDYPAPFFAKDFGVATASVKLSTITAASYPGSSPSPGPFYFPDDLESRQRLIDI